jgi:SAM-dependent methyltransferase
MSYLRDRLIEQYAEFYARVNSNIDPRSVKPRYQKTMQLMYGDLVSSLPSGSKVLDLGCGTGFLLNWLSQQPGIVPVGVDSSKSQSEIARRSLPGMEIYCRDGLDFLREHPDTFSGIFCTDLLEHIPGKDLCLEWVEAAASALKSGGFFYCRVPNAANLTGSYSRYMDLTHERSFTSTSLLQLLEASGLQNCRIMPIRTAHLSGRLRLLIEAVLHRTIFLICGRGMERVFTSNVCAVGFKK